MFLHIGEGITLLGKHIIAIIDKKTIEESADSISFIDDMIGKGCLHNDVDDVKTYIITSNGRKEKLYTSNISSTTLSKRNNNIKM